MWNRRLTLTELQSTRHHRNAQQAKQSVIFVPQRNRLTLFGEKRTKRPKKVPRDLEFSEIYQHDAANRKMGIH
ncbi:dCTP deaminase [Trichinella spiralis]|uniref:dCTP deaminase n=1 Tax=Trichinella spiralis TaxID=6334 RepID=A0ABR3K9G5_TRISP